jgi:DNA-binding NtrC family response regulator
MDWLQKPIDASRLIAVVSSVAASPNCLPRVLHVEDEADVRTIVASITKGYCELESVESVAAARAALAANKYDLVLLDIGLPDGSGLDLIDDIEQHISVPRIVIFSANDVSSEYADRVSAVLVKSRTGNDELLHILLKSMRKD